MAPFLIVVAILICHSGGNFLHAEKRFVEVGHAEMVVRMNGDVPDFSRHRASLLVCWILFKVEGFCQQRAQSAVSSSEFCVSSRSVILRVHSVYRRIELNPKSEMPNWKPRVNLTSAGQED